MGSCRIPSTPSTRSWIGGRRALLAALVDARSPPTRCGETECEHRARRARASGDLAGFACPTADPSLRKDGRTLERRPQSLEIARPHRDGPSACRPVGRVRESDEALAAGRLEELDDDGRSADRRRAAGRSPPRAPRPSPKASQPSAPSEVLRRCSRHRTSVGATRHGWATSWCRIRDDLSSPRARRRHRRRGTAGVFSRLASRRIPLARSSPRGRRAVAEARDQDSGGVLAPVPDQRRLGRLDDSPAAPRRPRSGLPARTHARGLGGDERDDDPPGHRSDYDAWARPDPRAGAGRTSSRPSRGARRVHSRSAVSPSSTFSPRPSCMRAGGRDPVHRRPERREQRGRRVRAGLAARGRRFSVSTATCGPHGAGRISRSRRTRS
jgi:hypothetical protein